MGLKNKEHTLHESGLCGEKWLLIVVLIFLVLSVFTGFSSSYCQTLEEWTNQKQLQTKYKLQQILALKSYSGSQEKGYKILFEGLSEFNSIVQEELDLHDSLFKSKEKVREEVLGIPLFSDLENRFLRSEELFNEIEKILLESEYLFQEERKTVTRLLLEGRSNLILLKQEQSNLLKDDFYAMDESKRIQRLRGIHTKLANQIQRLKTLRIGIGTLEKGRSRGKAIRNLIIKNYEIRKEEKD